MVGTVKSAELRHYAKFCRNRSNRGRDMWVTLTHISRPRFERPAIPMENGKIGVSELRNAWTDCHKYGHGWLRRRYDRARQNSNRSQHRNNWSPLQQCTTCYTVIYTWFILQTFTTRHSNRKLSIVTALSTTFTPCAPETTKFGKITQNKGYFAVQGHSRSPILVRIENPYTTYYQWLILTYLLSVQTVSDVCLKRTC